VLSAFFLGGFALLKFAIESNPSLGDINEAMPVSISAPTTFALVLMIFIGILDPPILFSKLLSADKIRTLVVSIFAFSGFAILFSFFGPDGLVWNTSGLKVWLFPMIPALFWWENLEAYGDSMAPNQWKRWNKTYPALFKFWSRNFFVAAIVCLAAAYVLGGIG